MADETKGSDQPETNSDKSSGWGIRAPRDTANHDWDRPPAPAAPAAAGADARSGPADSDGQPLPTTATTADHVHWPPAAPATAPAPVRKPRNPLVIVGAGVIVVAVIAAGALFVTSKGPETVVPLSTPVPSTVAVVHAGPAELELQSLTGGGSDANAEAARSAGPDRRVARPHQGVPPRHRSRRRCSREPRQWSCGSADPCRQVARQRAVLGGRFHPLRHRQPRRDGDPHQHLDRQRVPGAGAEPGRQPLRPVTDNVGRARRRQHVGGQPGVVYFYDPASGKGSQVVVGSNPAESAFYSKDGSTVWILEHGKQRPARCPHSARRCDAEAGDPDQARRRARPRMR